MNGPVDLAARILARRMRDAVAHHWDSDRCEVEARAFLAELRNQGWSPHPDATWWPRRRRRATPDHIAAMAAEAREAIRQARSTETEEPSP